MGVDAEPDAIADARGTPEVLRTFVTLCRHVARRTGGVVGEITPAGYTPNVHTAPLRYRDRQVDLLRHAELAVLALAEPRDRDACIVAFTDDAGLAEAIAEVSDLRVVGADEMNRPLTPDDLEKLGGRRNRDIRYWKPYTAGEVIFNFWD